MTTPVEEPSSGADQSPFGKVKDSPNKFASKSKPFVIGICGGDCSGKRLILNSIKQYFDRQNITIAPVPQECFLIHDRTFNRYEPNAFDWKKMIETISTLVAGEPAEVHPFDKIKEEPLDKPIIVNPSDIIVVHGLHILNFPELRKLFSLTCYVDSDDDIRLSRRLYQDVKMRGKSITQSIQNYLQNIKPSYELYTEPLKKVADLIVPKFGGDYIANEGNIQIAGFQKQRNTAVDFLLPAILDEILKQKVSKEGGKKFKTRSTSITETSMDSNTTPS